jgi:hypothetical protein
MPRPELLRCACEPGRRCTYHREYHRLWKQAQRRLDGVPERKPKAPLARPSMRCYRNGCDHADCRQLNAARVQLHRVSGTVRGSGIFA